MNNFMLTVCGVAFAGCIASTGDRIEIAEQNDLHIAAIETQRFDDRGSMYELRGLDAAGEQVALVRMRVGDIADLPDYLPTTDTFGSEIVLAAGGDERRIVSREVRLHYLQIDDSPAIRWLFAVHEVASALARANILVDDPAATGEAPFNAAPTACAPNQLLVTPLAKQCCYSRFFPGTLFATPSNQIISRRGQSNTCVMQDGSACSGAACYYGPNGFARPGVQTGTGYPDIYVTQNLGIYSCVGTFGPTPPMPPNFPDVTGTIPRGQGCPGGATGAGEWDY